MWTTHTLIFPNENGGESNEHSVALSGPILWLDLNYIKKGHLLLSNYIQ